VLQTLAFQNSADEPTTGQRVITITAVGEDEVPQVCSILVSVFPVNDNPPVVDLSGEEAASVNYTRTLGYNFTFQGSVAVAANTASITDRDGSLLRSLDVVLVPGYPNDGIFLAEEVGCPLDNTSMCYLR